jgi:hypothetical protein
MTYPNDGYEGYYILEGFAVKTQSGKCPVIYTSTGHWAPSSWLSCTSFPFSFQTRSLPSPCCAYEWVGNPPPPTSGAGSHRAFQADWAFDSGPWTQAAGLCTDDTLEIVPIITDGSPYGGGCPTCTGSVDVSKTGM